MGPSENRLASWGVPHLGLFPFTSSVSLYLMESPFLACPSDHFYLSSCRLLPASPSMPHICPHRHHLHTVQGLASLSGSCCSRCSQKKWPEVLLSPEAAAASTPAPTLLPNPSRAPKASAKTGRQGEITILSVGR